MTDKQNSLPWNIVENAINKEMNWLKEVLPTRSNAGVLSIMEGRESKCDSCDYNYRKIALLIVTGKIKAKEIKAPVGKDLWDGITKKVIKPIHKHGQE